MINLPDDLAQFIRAEVHSGHFVSEEAALVEAVRLLQNRLAQAGGSNPANEIGAPTSGVDPVLGALKDAAEEMDEVVEFAMKQREQQTWRQFSHE